MDGIRGTERALGLAFVGYRRSQPQTKMRSASRAAQSFWLLHASPLASGMNRTIGLVVLVLGLLVLFGGLGWAYKQYQDEQGNSENTPGPFTDPEESEENAGNGMNGLWLAAAGLVISIVGTVMLVMGGRSARTA